MTFAEKGNHSEWEVIGLMLEDIGLVIVIFMISLVALTIFGDDGGM